MEESRLKSDDMTQEEKAYELALKLEGEIGTSPHSRQAIKETIIKMATWKDEQFENIEDEIKIDAKKELAWEIHKIITDGVTLDKLDNYVCGICDF